MSLKQIFAATTTWLSTIKINKSFKAYSQTKKYKVIHYRFRARVMLLLFLRSKRSSSDEDVVSLLWMACFFILIAKQNRKRVMMMNTSRYFSKTCCTPQIKVGQDALDYFSFKWTVFKLITEKVDNWGKYTPNMASSCRRPMCIKQGVLALFSVHWLCKRAWINDTIVLY